MGLFHRVDWQARARALMERNLELRRLLAELSHEIHKLRRELKRLRGE